MISAFGVDHGEISKASSHFGPEAYHSFKIAAKTAQRGASEASEKSSKVAHHFSATHTKPRPGAKKFLFKEKRHNIKGTYIHPGGGKGGYGSVNTETTGGGLTRGAKIGGSALGGSGAAGGGAYAVHRQRRSK